MGLARAHCGSNAQGEGRVGDEVQTRQRSRTGEASMRPRGPQSQPREIRHAHADLPARRYRLFRDASWATALPPYRCRCRLRTGLPCEPQCLTREVALRLGLAAGGARPGNGSNGQLRRRHGLECLVRRQLQLPSCYRLPRVSLPSCRCSIFVRP